MSGGEIYTVGLQAYAARIALGVLQQDRVEALPNGGTLACEVEPWESAL